jgi:ankyrin repeat protein
MSGHNDVVRVLLSDERVNPVARNNQGNQAIHLAALRGYADTVSLLLNDARVDSNSTNNEGKKAIDLARRNGHITVVELIESLQESESITDMG